MGWENYGVRESWGGRIMGWVSEGHRYSQHNPAAALPRALRCHFPFVRTQMPACLPGPGPGIAIALHAESQGVYSLNRALPFWFN
jgi:hypothetical protein